MSKWWVLVTATAIGCAHAGDTPPVPLEVIVDQQVAAQAPGAVRESGCLYGTGEKTDFSLMLEAGKCYWFSGAGGDGVERLSLYLWGPPSGRRLADSRPHSSSTTLGHCPMMTGSYKLQAKIEGNGPYLVTVYSKPGAPVPTAQTVWAPPPVIVAPPPVIVAPPPARARAPECRMGSDGNNTCGYNCQLGSNGHFYCASVPNGTCALNSDGTWSCP